MPDQSLEPTPPAPSADARRQSVEVQAERRAAVVRLHLEGQSRAQIAKRTALSWATVDRAIRLYAEGGSAALVAIPRGRKPGTGAALNTDEEGAIRQMLRRPPRQHHVGAWLWTRAAVDDLISRTFGVRMKERALASYLDAWGLRPGNLERRPEDRCSPRARQWLETDFSEVHSRARREDIDMYWLHRPRRLDATLWNRSTPPKQNWLASASTMQGKLYFKVVEGAYNPTAQVTFIKALLRESARTSMYAFRDDDATYNSSALKSALEDTCVKIYPQVVGGAATP